MLCTLIQNTQKIAAKGKEKPPSHVLMLTELQCSLTGVTRVLLACRAVLPGCWLFVRLVAMQQEDSAATHNFLEEVVSDLVFMSSAAFLF